MIRKILSRLIKWAVVYSENEVKVKSSRSVDGIAPIRISMFQAFNGKVLEIQTHQPTNMHSDWASEYMLVPEGEDLYSAIATILLSHRVK